jgi:hypothetical protein
VNKFETARNKLKIGFAATALVLLLGVPPLTPYIWIWRLGRIPLSPMQMFYAVLSIEIVLAVYIWGVGNWSRFEPPHTPSASEDQELNRPTGTPQPPAAAALGGH